MRALPLTLTALVCAALAACAVGPNYQAPHVTLTQAYVGHEAITEGITPQAWWQGFQDPLLDKTVERALAANLDLAQALARVTQARAIAQSAGTRLLPVVDAAGDTERVHGSLKSPMGALASAVGAPRDHTDHAIGVQASWELDLFGTLRRRREAAQAEAQAALANAGAMRIAIAAEASDAYLALRGLQARLAVAQEQERTQSKLLALIQQRCDEGVSSDRERQRALGALEGTRASMAPLVAAIDGQLARLDVLMGAQAGTHRAEYGAVAAVPMPVQPSASLTPSDLLRRRPDVIAAEQQLRAANARIGAAMGEYYPHASLGAALGFASMGSSAILSSEAAQSQGLVGLRWRLFDFGRIDAEVAVAQGREAQALAAYRAAILKASEDVETALSRYVQRGVETQALTRQIAALTAARAQALVAYQHGVVGLIDVLDADRELLSASDKLAAARSEQARASVAAFRALGGGWSG